MKRLFLAAILALVMGGCNLPETAIRQFIIDFHECGMVCLIDNIKQIEG